VLYRTALRRVHTRWSCAEELDRIEEGLDVINNDMKQAEIALKKMGKCCGICTMPWKR
jgi:hypothetical protein